VTLEQRIRSIEEQLENHEDELVECIFCRQHEDPQTGQTDHLTYKFNSMFFADDLVRQAIYSETGSYKCNHETYSHDSIILANFISNSIHYNNANIDQYNPSEFISLVSDFKKMDSVLEHYKNKENTRGNQLDSVYEKSKQLIRKVGREWIMSQDPDKYDIGYLYMVEKYGKGFDLPKIYWESGYQDVQKKKLVGLGIGYPFNREISRALD